MYLRTNVLMSAVAGIWISRTGTGAGCMDPGTLLWTGSLGAFYGIFCTLLHGRHHGCSGKPCHQYKDIVWVVGYCILPCLYYLFGFCGSHQREPCIPGDIYFSHYFLCGISDHHKKICGDL